MKLFQHTAMIVRQIIDSNELLLLIYKKVFPKSAMIVCIKLLTSSFLRVVKITNKCFCTNLVSRWPD